MQSKLHTLDMSSEGNWREHQPLPFGSLRHSSISKCFHRVVCLCSGEKKQKTHTHTTHPETLPTQLLKKLPFPGAPRSFTPLERRRTHNAADHDDRSCACLGSRRMTAAKRFSCGSPRAACRWCATACRAALLSPAVGIVFRRPRSDFQGIQDTVNHMSTHMRIHEIDSLDPVLTHAGSPWRGT